MANTIYAAALDSAIILQESLDVFDNNTVALSFVHTEYSSQFAQAGARKGDTINARVPPRYIESEGEDLVIQDATESTVPIRLEHQDHIGLEFSNRDLTLSIDRFRERFLEEAVSQLANKQDLRVLGTYRDFATSVGTPGTTPTSLLTYWQAGARLSDMAVPRGNQRAIFLTPEMEVLLLQDARGLFHQADQIAKQYTNGQMGRSGGFLFHMDQNCPTHTVGPLGGVPLTNGVDQTGSTLITDAWTNAAANRVLWGDTFTIGSIAGGDGVQEVNPRSRQATGRLRQFSWEADYDSDSSGNLTGTIYPPIIPSGQFQTVDRAAVNNSTINMIGAANTTFRMGIALHKSAISYVSADLEVPNGADMAGRISDDKIGVSMRLWRDGVILKDKRITRLDILNGQKVVRRYAGLRINSLQ